jgi:D-ribose pyranose/furanose isomerase RbsD
MLNEPLSLTVATVGHPQDVNVADLRGFSIIRKRKGQP